MFKLNFKFEAIMSYMIVSSLFYLWALVHGISCKVIFEYLSEYLLSKDYVWCVYFI